MKNLIRTDLQFFAGTETPTEITEAYRKEARKIADTFEKVLIENEALKKELYDLKRQGGEIAMERSWKVKYKKALTRANIKLIKAGLDPIRIRNRQGLLVDPIEVIEEEDGQMAMNIGGDSK